jgi:23S rRNA A2030 N6-methylase RlmJ
MPDQRKNAGNIGDVVKHAILPELVSLFDKLQQGQWVYCETHAGFYEYPLDLLRTEKGQWSGERAWGIGLIQPQHYRMLGLYGKQLGVNIPRGFYPGSICLIDAVISKNAVIRGRDIKDEQVASYQGKSQRIGVAKGDGYLMTDQMPKSPRLVFCDPFWKGSQEATKVQGMLGSEEAVVVWYPLSTGTVQYRKWQQRTVYSFIEIEFIDYKPKKDGWSGQGDMKGAGLTIKGLPPESILRAREVGMVLKDIFAGQAGKGRKFDLRVTVSN